MFNVFQRERERETWSKIEPLLSSHILSVQSSSHHAADQNYCCQNGTLNYRLLLEWLLITDTAGIIHAFTRPTLVDAIRVIQMNFISSVISVIIGPMSFHDCMNPMLKCVRIAFFVIK